MLKDGHRAPPCILKKQPQATSNSKEKGFIWQNKLQQHWNIIYVRLCVILGMKGLIYENDQGCKRQPQATGNSKEQSFVWQNKVQQYWNITNLNFGVIWGMKGLIYENAQGWQLGTLLYFGKGPPSYKKQQRKNNKPTKQGMTPCSQTTRFYPNITFIY